MLSVKFVIRDSCAICDFANEKNCCNIYVGIMFIR